MKRLLLVSLLIGASVSAQIPGRLDSLQARVFIRLKLPVTGTASTTPAIVWQVLNNSQTPVCQDFDAFEKFDTVTVWGGPEGAALNADFLRISGVDRMIGDTGRYPMQEIGQKERWEKGGALAGSSYNRDEIEHPRYYYIHGKRIVTYPKDRKVSTDPDSLFIGYWANASPLTAAADSTDIFPEYREALLLKACAGVWAIRGSSAEAAAYETLYATEVAKYGRAKK